MLDRNREREPTLRQESPCWIQVQIHQRYERNIQAAPPPIDRGSMAHALFSVRDAHWRFQKRHLGLVRTSLETPANHEAKDERVALLE